MHARGAGRGYLVVIVVVLPVPAEVDRHGEELAVLDMLRCSRAVVHRRTVRLDVERHILEGHPAEAVADYNAALSLSPSKAETLWLTRCRDRCSQDA